MTVPLACDQGNEEDGEHVQKRMDEEVDKYNMDDGKDT